MAEGKEQLQCLTEELDAQRKEAVDVAQAGEEEAERLQARLSSKEAEVKHDVIAGGGGEGSRTCFRRHFVVDRLPTLSEQLAV